MVNFASSSFINEAVVDEGSTLFFGVLKRSKPALKLSEDSNQIIKLEDLAFASIVRPKVVDFVTARAWLQPPSLRTIEIFVVQHALPAWFVSKFSGRSTDLASLEGTMVPNGRDESSI